MKHPDYRGLSLACQILDETIARVDKAQVSGKGDFLPHKFQPLLGDLVRNPSHQYLTHFTVCVDKIPHDLVIFLGVLALVGPSDGGERPFVTRFPLLESTVERHGGAGVRLVHGGEAWTSVCASAEIREALVETVRKANAEMGGNKLSLLWELASDSQQLPTLHGHAMFEARGVLWIYGGRNGKNEISDRVYRITFRPLAIRAIAADCPPPRLRFAAALAGDHTLYLYGGTPDGRAALGDLWAFDLGNEVWRRPQQSGVQPPPIIGAALVACPNCLLLIGGRARTDGLQCPFFRFLLDTQHWEEVRSDRPGPRLEWHSAVARPNGDVIVIAGKTESELFAVLGHRIQAIRTTGIPPLAQQGRKKKGPEDEFQLPVTAAVMCGGHVFVFGDKHGMRVYCAEIDALTPQWTALEVSAQTPLVPVSSYALCMGKDRIWLYGGITHTNKVENALYEVQVRVPQRAPRTFISMSKSLNFLGLDDREGRR
jgi:hypothetical protein